MVFCQHLCEKCQIWVFKRNLEEARGDARPWLMARWKAHVDFRIQKQAEASVVGYINLFGGRNN